MAYIDNINYQETKSKKRIVLKSKWLDLMDTIVFFMMSASLLLSGFLIFNEANLKSPNDSFLIYWIFPFLAVFILFAIYKKIREKRLLTIETNLEKTEARKQIVSIIESWGWKIQKNNGDYLQATTGIGLTTWGKQVIVIYDIRKIYLNVMSDNPKVRMPVIFSDKSIKRDIEKELKASR